MELFNVTSSPHVREKTDTQRIMLYVILSLIPAACFGVYNFGYKALVLIVVTILSCVCSEWIYNRIVHKKQTVTDLSAVVTGLLLAMNLPSSLPWWMAVLGGMFAIFVVKCVFGGLGQNFMNPALGGRCFLMISFTGPMTKFSEYKDFDAFSGATPLATIKAGGTVDVMRELIGTIPGTIGETSVICLLLGAIFLLITGVIDLKIPATYIITFVIFAAIFGGHGFDSTYLVSQICGGGLILGAFFMATDYVTAPITPNGKILYGICLGILTGVFRIFGASAEGVSYAIIFSNLLVPLIERVTIPRAFGIVKEKKGGDAA